jgi:preprotein translocase subunit YajC
MNTEGLLYLLIFVAAGVILWFYIKRRTEQDKATKEMWPTFAGMKGLQEGKPEDPSDLLF